MTTLSMANTTAQWYEDTYLGGYQPRLEKVVLHSTETKGMPGYGGGASAPNATYHPLERELRQHFSNERSARALRDPSDTPVRENRDGVWQLEIVAYSDKRLGDSVGGLWIGDLKDEHYNDIADMLIELHEKHSLPLHSEVQWREGQKTYVSGVRLSGPEFDRAKGILAHMHVSGNDHWDVGGFYWSKLEAAINRRLGGGGEDVATPEENWDHRSAFPKWITDIFTKLRDQKWTRNAIVENTYGYARLINNSKLNNWKWLKNRLGRAVWFNENDKTKLSHSLLLRRLFEVIVKPIKSPVTGVMLSIRSIVRNAYKWSYYGAPSLHTKMDEILANQATILQALENHAQVMDENSAEFRSMVETRSASVDSMAGSETEAELPEDEEVVESDVNDVDEPEPDLEEGAQDADR